MFEFVLISTITFNNKATDLLFKREIIFIIYLPKSKKDAVLLWQMKNDVFPKNKQTKEIFNNLHFGTAVQTVKYINSRE